MRYFSQKIDFVKYIQNLFSENNEVTYINGSKMPISAITELLYKNMNYVYEIESVAGTYAIDPYLLEYVLELRHLSFKDFKSNIKSAYRFLDVIYENSTTIIKGLVGDKYHTIFFNDRLINSCSTILSYIDNSPHNFTVNGNVTNLYGIMKLFNQAVPNGLTRYKGLGEMQPSELAESTFLKENRTLIQFTIDDVKAEIEAIRHIETNRMELLKSVTVTKEDVM